MAGSGKDATKTTYLLC